MSEKRIRERAREKWEERGGERARRITLENGFISPGHSPFRRSYEENGAGSWLPTSIVDEKNQPSEKHKSAELCQKREREGNLDGIIHEMQQTARTTTTTSNIYIYLEHVDGSATGSISAVQTTSISTWIYAKLIWLGFCLLLLCAGETWTEGWTGGQKGAE